MLKINLKYLMSPVSPGIFWPILGVVLIGCITLYTLKEKEKTLRFAAQNELAKTMEAKKVLETDLAQVREEMASKDEQITLISDKLEKEINARREAEVRLILVSEAKNMLEGKIQALWASTKNVELEKIVVKPAPESTGKILSLDKEHNFIVTDLGSKDNLKLGDILSVYHGDKFIGQVQVEKIEERASAAVIMPDWQSVEFEENDEVRKI